MARPNLLLPTAGPATLVDSYVTKPPEVNGARKSPFPEWLEPMQQRWRAGIDWENLPWFAEEKAKSGRVTRLFSA
jgi:hypothetical protein